MNALEELMGDDWYETLMTDVEEERMEEELEEWDTEEEEVAFELSVLNVR